MLTALRVLEEVAARQPVGVSDLSRALDLPKTPVPRAVTTLAGAGWWRTTGPGPAAWFAGRTLSEVLPRETYRSRTRQRAIV